MNLVECYQCLGLKPFATIENVNMAYKRLAGPWLRDRLQVDGRPCIFEDRNSGQINIARDWLVAHLEDIVNVNGQDVEKIRLSINLGQVSTFISECCSYDSSSATERLDLYIDYRDWCFQSHLCPVSMPDFERTLTELGFSTIIEKSGPIEKIYWQGIEPSGYWYFVNDPDRFTVAYASDFDPNRVEAKEYADMDDDDDLSEAAF
jgi:hypothetical protein